MKKVFDFIKENRYFVMFMTTFVYLLGLFAYFSSTPIVIAVIVSIIAVILVKKGLLSYKLILFFIFMFYFAFFNADFRLKNHDDLIHFAPIEATISGQIVSVPNSNSKNVSKFFFMCDSVETNFFTKNISPSKTMITIRSEDGNFKKLKIGNYYKIKGKLQKPFHAGNPSQFDYGKYLKNFNTFTVFYGDIENCEVLEHKLSPKWSFIQNLNITRNNIINIHSKYLKSPNLEILGGIVFGDDAIAPPDYIKTTFINSGLLHILAASGMNVAFIYGFWYFFMRRIFRLPFKITVLGGIGVVILYSLMTGLGPSVIRAAFMFVFILIGKLLDRDANSISLLAFVGLLMLIYNPAFVHNVSFQLSFVVTFGLLLSCPVIFEKIKFIPNFLSGIIFVPIIAQLWVLPIQMYYFNTVSVYSIFANIIMVPFLAIISFGGFVSSVLAIFKPVADIVCSVFDIVLNPFLNILVAISNYFSQLNHSILTTTQPSGYQILLYYVILTTLVFMLKYGFKNKKLIITVCLMISVLALSTLRIDNGKFDVIVFDVGNADAFLLKSPDGKYFLIDSAKVGYNGGKTQAEYIILEYMKDYGIKNIEAFIITHFDNDHSGSVIELLENLNIKQIYINSFDNKDVTSKRIYNYLQNNNVKVNLVKNNETIYSHNDFSIKTFFADFKNTNDGNENSIVTLTTYKNSEILFMGDAGVRCFDRIKEYLPKNIDVLKVGHHGGSGSVNSEMMNYLNPSYAVISVGKNIYGHPHPITLRELENTKILRTDKLNSVKIQSDGNICKTFKYEKLKRTYRPID